MNKNNISFLMLILLVSVLPACWRKKDEYREEITIHNGRKTRKLEMDVKIDGDTDLELSKRHSARPNCKKSKSCAKRRMNDADDMDMMTDRDRPMTNNGRRTSNNKMTKAQMRIQEEDMSDMDDTADVRMNETDRQMMMKRGK